MTSDFKKIYEKIVRPPSDNIEDESGDDSIESSLEDIKNIYGEEHKDQLVKLFDRSDRFSQDLKELGDDVKQVKSLGKNPKNPTYKKNYKNNAAIVKKYNLQVSDYSQFTVRNALAEYKKTLYTTKIKDMSEIVVTQSGKTVIPNDLCQLEYVLGNSKVGDDTIIINMGPATVCDAAKDGQCDLYRDGFCYAQNNEGQYRTSFAKRFKQKLQWRYIPTDVLAAQIATVIICLRNGVKYGENDKKRSNVKYIRFNESGDFDSKADFKKLEDITRLINQHLTELPTDVKKHFDELGVSVGKQEPITIYTYTHRSDLFENNKSPSSLQELIIQGSGKYNGSDKKDTSAPFMLDNCFMGIDYDNLVSLVREGDFDQIHNHLGIEFPADFKKNIFICRGTCLNCTYCKRRGKNLILVCYHGIGTKSQSILMLMRRKVKKALELSNATALTIAAGSLDTDLKNEIINVTHFNENSLVEKLIELASYKKTKNTWRRPLISMDSIFPFVKEFRDIADKEFKELTKGDIRINKPRSLYLNPDGYKAKDKEIEEEIASAVLKNEKIAEKLANAGIIPENYTFYDYRIDTMLSEKKEGEQDDLSSMDMQKLSNLAVANKLSSHKQFVPPGSIQYLFDENGYDLNVMGDDEISDITSDEEFGVGSDEMTDE